MKRTLHIVSQCTDRKKFPTDRGLRLRKFRDGALARRADAWAAAVRHAPNVGTARSLYAGEHWVATLDLEAAGQAKGFDVRLWVVSAGLGLISAQSEVPSYSATFSSNVADSVLVREGDLAGQRQEWFRRVSASLGRSPLAAIGAREPGATVVCILSRSYLQAVQSDLSALRSQLADANRLIVVTGDAPEVTSGDLASSWVPSSSRLSQIVGGTRVGQHARVAKTLFDRLPPTHIGASLWRRQVTRWLEDAPEVQAYDRTPMTDRDVQAFAKRSAHTSWSRALRELRESGRACEQKRFRRIFQEVRAS